MKVVTCIIVLTQILITHCKSECPKKVVACYYSSWSIYREVEGKFTINDIDVSLCTHLIYSFAGLDINSRITSLDPQYDITNGGYKAFTALKEQNPCLKTLLAIGGWNEGSRKFSIMSSLNASRVDFAESVIRYLVAYDFDGLDFDWEYPTERGGIPDDKEDFVELLKYLRDRFEKWGLLLTIAAPLDVNYLSRGYLLDKIKDIVNYVFLMAYDYTAVDSKVTGLLAPMTPIKKAVEYLISKVGAGKLVLGLPTYARSFILLNPAQNNVGALTNGTGFEGKYTKTGGFLAYYEALQYINTGKYQVEMNDGTCYAYYSLAWFSFDTEDTYKEKVKYAKENQLAGVMVWSIDTDDFKGIQSKNKYPILNWIREVL